KECHTWKVSFAGQETTFNWSEPPDLGHRCLSSPDAKRRGEDELANRSAGGGVRAKPTGALRHHRACRGPHPRLRRTFPASSAWGDEIKPAASAPHRPSSS